MEEIKLNYVRCKRCDYKWVPRVSVIRICPKCKSPYWDVERRKKKK